MLLVHDELVRVHLRVIEDAACRVSQGDGRLDSLSTVARGAGGNGSESDGSVTAEPGEHPEVAGRGDLRLRAERDRGIRNDRLPGVDVGRGASTGRQLHAGSLSVRLHRREAHTEGDIDHRIGIGVHATLGRPPPGRRGGSPAG